MLINWAERKENKRKARKKQDREDNIKNLWIALRSVQSITPRKLYDKYYNRAKYGCYVNEPIQSWIARFNAYVKPMGLVLRKELIEGAEYVWVLRSLEESPTESDRYENLLKVFLERKSIPKLEVTTRYYRAGYGKAQGQNVGEWWSGFERYISGKYTISIQLDGRRVILGLQEVE